LFSLEPAKVFDGECREGDRSILASFGVLEANFGFGLFQTLDDPEDTAIQINVFPTQRKYLAPPHARRKRKHHRPIGPKALVNKLLSGDPLASLNYVEQTLKAQGLYPDGD
jgi:hypothetical protein